MKGTSKVIMGATLVMVVTLAVVLGLIFVLLAELYCSLLLCRRRRLQNRNSIAVPTATTQTRASASLSSHLQQHSPPHLSSIYAQGVLQAPRSLLLPAVSSKEDIAGPRKHYSDSELHQVVEIQTLQEFNASPCQVGVLSPASLIFKTPIKPFQEQTLKGIASESLCLEEVDDKPCSVGEQLVYISNPIYENDESKDTPFETPDTSPSRLEDDIEASSSSPWGHSPSNTPPLTPMKKLPADACSVSLRDATSFNASASDSHSHNGLSSSSSGSPSTSPSW